MAGSTCTEVQLPAGQRLGVWRAEQASCQLTKSELESKCHGSARYLDCILATVESPGES